MKVRSINQPYLRLRNDHICKCGGNPIELCISLDGKLQKYSTGCAVPLKYWDAKKLLVKDSFTDADYINSIIETELLKAKDIVRIARFNRQGLSATNFKEQYVIKHNLVDKNDTDFLEFARNEIELEKKKGNKAPGTVEKYRYQLNKLIRFKSKISFDDLTETFLADFNEYMHKTLGNDFGGANNTLKFIRKFNNTAVKKGLTSNYAFKNYLIKEQRNETIKHLTLDEFKKVKEYYWSLSQAHKHYRALKSFLFSCYTGLRYGDGKRFTLDDIVDNNINVQTEKTKTLVVVPLLSQAKELLNYSLAPSLPNLNTPCDQTCNRALKEIAKICKIDKLITTHYARHTFACFALNKGVSKTTVQSILGHKTSKQTDHYAKLWDTTKNSEMAKMEGVF